MKIIDLLQTANSNIWRDKTRTILTLAAIVLGTTTVILSVSLGNGANNYIENLAQSYSLENQLVVTKYDNSGAQGSSFGEPTKFDGETGGQFGNKVLKQEDVDAVKKIKNVSKVNTYPAQPISLQYIQYNNGDKYQGSLVDYNPEDRSTFSLLSGTFDGFISGDVVLPPSYVRALSLGSESEAVGKTVLVRYKTINSQLIDKSYKVKAIIKPNLLNSQDIIIPRDEYVALDNINNPEKIQQDAYPYLNVYLKDGLSKDEIQQARNDITKVGLFSTTVIEQSKTILNIITTLQTGLGIFSALIIIASLFGVTNTLLMSILERTREIGLMKALGMTNGQVLALVTLESAFLGFWGGFSGLLIALGLGSVLNSVASNTILKGFEGYTPLEFSWGTSVLILLIIVAVCYIISFIPARRAVKIQPTEALKEE